MIYLSWDDQDLSHFQKISNDNQKIFFQTNFPRSLYFTKYQNFYLKMILYLNLLD